MPFHVLNRAVGRRTVFESAADYAGFLDVMAEALRTRPMRICGYCVMPNHWHMVLWPERDGDLPAFVQHVSNLHVKRWKKVHREVGEGHLYQGRYKSFPIQSDAYFQTVIRYVERNPLRANPVARAEDWPWSSLGQASSSASIPLAAWPVPQPGEHARCEAGPSGTTPGCSGSPRALTWEPRCDAGDVHALPSQPSGPAESAPRLPRFGGWHLFRTIRGCNE